MNSIREYIVFGSMCVVGLSFLAWFGFNLANAIRRNRRLTRMQRELSNPGARYEA